MRKRVGNEPQSQAIDVGDTPSSISSLDNGPPTRRTAWKQMLHRRLPITAWLPLYTWPFFFQDLLAGVTVALTEIPQGIAYAIVAGLPSQYGLYSGLMDGLMYFFFGGCKDINVGPTAILALFVQPFVTTMGPAGAVLMTFISGTLIFIAGILHLGFLVEFFSVPVISGFTTAAALSIASSQLKSLLGISGSANQFLDAWKAFFKNIKETSLWDSVLGFVSVIVLFGFREIRRWGSMTDKPEWSRKRNVIGRFIFLLSLAGNALVVIAGATVGYVAERYYNATPVTLTGEVEGGWPPLGWPPFGTTYNGTVFTFTDMLSNYGTSIAFVPLVAFLEHIAIVKAFTKGKIIDATQELIALGLGNIMGSLVSSMPVTGSFTRTAVNNASGAKTTTSTLITSLLLLLALGVLTGSFKYIPKSTLAAVVMVAMYYLCEFSIIPLMWRTKRLDLIPYFATLLCGLFLSLEYGIIIGIASNLVFVLYESARPKLYIEKVTVQDCLVYLVRPKGSLYFPSAEHLREEVIKNCTVKNSIVVLDGEFVRTVDGTVAKSFTHLLDDLDFRNQRLVLWNFSQSVKDICSGGNELSDKYFKNGELEVVIESVNVLK